MEESRLRDKIYETLEGLSKYHYSDINSCVNGKHFSVNPVLETLTYFLDANCLLTGDPGWGKTTSAKIITAMLSGLPYDLLDSTEIRGNPHLYEEKLTGRFDFHKLVAEGEKVIWRSSFSMPSLIIDEANWIPYEGQAVILQGIETGRWLYQDYPFYEGKKPAYFAVNKRPEEGNGLWHALEDRIHINLVYEPLSTLNMPLLSDAKANLENNLCNPEFTKSVTALLQKNRDEFKESLKKAPKTKTAFSGDEKASVKTHILSLPFDDDATLFLQSFAAEINFNNRYGKKRSEDPLSDDTHDANYIGVFFRNTFSPRTWMAVQEYSSALAWLLGDKKVTREHIEFIIPYTIHHKIKPTTDLKNDRAKEYRKIPESLFIAEFAVRRAVQNYASSIQKSKNLISEIQSGKLTKKRLDALKEEDYDHPLIKDVIRKIKERKPFYDHDNKINKPSQ